MTPVTNAFSSYPSSAYCFQTFWTGEKPLPEIDKKKLHPSRYQVSHVERIVHLACGIFRWIFKPAKSVAQETSTRPPFPMHREYREISKELVAPKLQREKERCRQAQRSERDGTTFDRMCDIPRLVTPDLNKRRLVLTHEEQKLNIDIAWTKGRRPSMEDRNLAVSFFLDIEGESIPVTVFAIFDGHGGKEAAIFSKDNLPTFLKNQLERGDSLSEDLVFNALKLAFVDLDIAFNGPSGCTACAAILLGSNLWVANVGDSRAILCDGDRVEQLSEDAKPANPRFKRGIEKRGGEVIKRPGGIPRVNQSLAVARAIGDHSFDGSISARPKITKTPLSTIGPDGYLLIACDGLWDVCSSNQAGFNVSLGAKRLITAAYHAKSSDNLSVMVVSILDKGPRASAKLSGDRVTHLGAGWSRFERAEELA